MSDNRFKCPACGGTVSVDPNDAEHLWCDECEWDNYDRVGEKLPDPPKEAGTPPRGSKVYLSDRKAHDLTLRAYVEERWKGRDVLVDWEWSGPGYYRIHEHVGAGLPCISLKWEGI